MSELARWLGRLVWGAMLRFLRTPWVRSIRRYWLRVVPAATARRMIRQDRFARRHGLAVVVASLNLMLASFAISGCFIAARYLLDSGLLGPTH